MIDHESQQFDMDRVVRAGSRYIEAHEAFIQSEAIASTNEAILSQASMAKSGMIDGRNVARTADAISSWYAQRQFIRRYNAEWPQLPLSLDVPVQNLVLVARALVEVQSIHQILNIQPIDPVD